MKLEFTAIITQVGEIEPRKSGFTQTNIFWIPELKDDFDGRLKRKEQFFQLQIYSTNHTDSRFLTPGQLNQKKIVSAYLNGERYMQEGKFDYSYFTRLNLIDLKDPA
jgi:hypothetical protein